VGKVRRLWRVVEQHFAQFIRQAMVDGEMSDPECMRVEPPKFGEYAGTVGIEARLDELARILKQSSRNQGVPIDLDAVETLEYVGRGASQEHDRTVVWHVWVVDFWRDLQFVEILQSGQRPQFLPDRDHRIPQLLGLDAVDLREIRRHVKFSL